MKKLMDFTLVSKTAWKRAVLLRLQPVDEVLPAIFPGQFVQVRIDHTPEAYLRRPISIHWVDVEHNELYLLVQLVGAGTRYLAQLSEGDRLNLLLPLGNGFSIPETSCNCLLVGGGIGVAPLLYLGKCLKEKGHSVQFLLGARSAADLVRLEAFEALAPVSVTTEDGSMGEKGFVTGHPVLDRWPVDAIACCGPLPMMKAVAKLADSKGIDCEVSLENRMACGLGACLCCVENTREQGHVCVCQDGPVFNTKQLLW